MRMRRQERCCACSVSCMLQMIEHDPRVGIPVESAEPSLTLCRGIHRVT